MSALRVDAEKLEATPGFEPGVKALQASALPLGHVASSCGICHERGRPGRCSGRPFDDNGADNGIRTRDPHLGKVVLYQLSHVRVARKYISGSDRDAQGCFWNFSLRGRLEIFGNGVLPPEDVLVEYSLADAETRRSPQRGRLAQGESTTLTR